MKQLKPTVSDSAGEGSSTVRGEQQPVQPARRWKRWCWGLLASGLLLWLAGPTILRGIAAPLRHSEIENQVDALLVLDGGRGYTLAADWVNAGLADEVLLYDRQPGRVVSLGILPTHLELATQAAGKANLPAGRLRVLDIEPVSDLDELLKQVIELHSDDYRIGLVVSEWRSGLIYQKLRVASGGKGRPLLILIDDPEVLPDCWWRTRHGVRQVAMSWISLISECCFTKRRRPALTNDDFRRAAVIEHSHE